MVDADGRSLSDYTSGIYGKSNAIIREAVTAAIQDGLQFGGHTPHEARLARGLVARYPAMDLVRFTNSGTEANLLGIAAALRYTRRHKVVVFDHAYHGSLLAHFHTGEGKGHDVEGFLRVPFVGSWARRAGRSADGCPRTLSSLHTTISRVRSGWSDPRPAMSA